MRIALCTVAGALLGGGIAVNVATRQVDGWALIIPLGGATVGAVTG